MASSQFDPTIMSVIIRILAVAILMSFLPAGPDAYGQTGSMNATAVEIAQMPRFCWAQFAVPNADGDEFAIHACGPSANHYCGGVIYLIRARHAASKAERLDLLRHADEAVSDTERAIKDYPKCSIREHVDATRTEVNNLLVIYGGKRAKAH